MNDVTTGRPIRCFALMISMLWGIGSSASIHSDYSWLLDNDTLIIDGDTIFIERQEGMLLTDSVDVGEPELPALKRPPLRIWSAAIAFGMNATVSSWLSLSSDLKTVDEFMGRKAKVGFNPIISAECGARFAAIQMSGGKIELNADVGIGYNQVISHFTSLADEAQLEQDSVLSIGTNSNELFITYFQLTNPPDEGEVDTLFFDLQSSELRLSTIDVPLKLRATLQRNASPVRFFLETGIVRRVITATHFNGRQLLLHQDGTNQFFTAEDFQAKRILVPHFALGVERKIPIGKAIDQKYCALGTRFAAAVPGVTWNNSNDLSLDVGNFSLTVFGRFFF